MFYLTLASSLFGSESSSLRAANYLDPRSSARAKQETRAILCEPFERSLRVAVKTNSLVGGTKFALAERSTHRKRAS